MNVNGSSFMSFPVDLVVRPEFGDSDSHRAHMTPATNYFPKPIKCIFRSINGIWLTLREDCQREKLLILVAIFGVG